ncbi:POT family protein [Trichuris trichiura]|uniref:Oligopeptide transporter 1 n=1 Tax=Trichuris trichiura TaxID=36087 RepID=A0A077Z1T8_TRITR|nr:POT family protein [Trichuris trichiura]
MPDASDDSTAPTREEKVDIPQSIPKADEQTGSLGLKSLKNYPAAIFFILGNEFAERFSFYGMRAVLILYLTTVFMLNDSTAKLAYHSFIALAFLSPLFGSVLADGFFGRYRLILYVTILYTIGQAMLAVSSMTSLLQAASQPLSYVSLLIIAFATGGIKPNVSSFAADQFPPHMTRERSQFFSLFYFTINLGSMISFIVTPYLRGQVSCDGQETCFPLAFGVPAVCMCLALFIFLIGKPFYTRKPAQSAVLVHVVQCTIYAIRERLRRPRKASKMNHWLDYASPKFNDALIRNVKCIFAVALVFLPAISWTCLYDQTGSSWILQASRMNGHVGALTVLPDQVSAINPLLIILLVPLFEGIIYPTLNKRGFLKAPLRRMLYGLLLAIAAASMAGVVQLFVKKGLALPAENGNKQLLMYNQNECSMELMINGLPSGILEARAGTTKLDISCSDKVKWQPVNCSVAAAESPKFISNANCDPRKGTFYVIWDGINTKTTTIDYSIDQGVDSITRVYLVFESFVKWGENATLTFWNGAEQVASVPIQGLEAGKRRIDLKPSVFGRNVLSVILHTCNAYGKSCEQISLGQVQLHMGSSVALTVSDSQRFGVATVVPGYSISILWQLPQWVVMTVSEILFSISGLEFAYSEADASVKSVMSAIWLMTTFLGNVLVMIISGSHLFTDLVVESFFYTGLMVLSALLFYYLSHTTNEKSSEETTALSDKKVSTLARLKSYPTAIYFILGNEFAERFSYYGMRAVLILYLTTILLLNDSTAKIVYHTFTALAYLFPMVGSILADGFFGRYNVILYVSILYVIGQSLLSVSAITSLLQGASQPLTYVSLLIIAFATGGIKPNVSSLAADQFPAHMTRERSLFFSMFYFFINLGSLLSFIITPYLRSQISCDGRESCFPLAFGVPAICMFLALIIFLLGRSFYYKAPAQGAVLVQVCQCVMYAIKQRFRSSKSEDKPAHWLDRASPKFSEELIKNVKTIFGVTVVFLPAVFWTCLYDQTGSAWVLQASHMNGAVGGVTILPDQLSAANPLLIIILVPLFEGFIYPCLTKRGFLSKPLRRMGYGLLLSTVAMAISGVVQIFVQREMPTLPADGSKQVILYNGNNCTAEYFVNGTMKGFLDVATPSIKFDVKCGSILSIRSVNCLRKIEQTVVVGINDCQMDKGQFYFIGSRVITTEYKIQHAVDSATRLYVLAENQNALTNQKLTLWRHSGLLKSVPIDKFKPNEYVEVKPAIVGQNVLDIKITTCETNGTQCSYAKIGEVRLHMGSSIVLILNDETNLKTFTTVAGYKVSILWQIPQWVIMTTSEILFSISGLEFAYSEAAPSVKSVMSAVWLMTTFLGNVLVILISGTHMFADLVVETFVYTGIMVIISIVFVFLARRYRYSTER